MPPNAGLVHLKEYDIKDSNVELIGSEIDHQVKYNSAKTEPAWNDGKVGESPGLLIWRIEQFEVVPLPREQYGQFYDGDSYIVLHSYKLGDDDKLGHEIFFWLGEHTTQDEAGTAAYKTVELDEFLRGAATQHREIQSAPSEDFLALFPRLSIRSGGVRSGFRHVEQDAEPKPVKTLLRVFKNTAAGPGAKGIIVYEVEPTWRSLDEDDVFILDVGDKIWVWQGKNCSPMEKAKAAQVVHDMTLAKHIDVEVLSQDESRSTRVIGLLDGDDSTPLSGFKKDRPFGSGAKLHSSSEQKKLFRISDSSGQLSFSSVKDGGRISRSDLDTNDVFLLDNGGQAVWVWVGSGASHSERAKWLHIARAYINQLLSTQDDAYRISLAKVSEGNESKAFFKAIEA
jgi:gelsolin